MVSGVALAEDRYRVVDGRERTVVFENPPSRIISLSPAATEILFAVGAGDQVIAVTDFCRFPEAVTALPKVGALLNPSMERILALKPDLVILPNTRDTALMRQLDRLGIRVLVLHPEGLANIAADIRLVGEATGQGETGQAISKSWDVVLQPDDEPLSPRPRVLLRIGDLAAGPGSYLGELLEAAGGNNSAAGAASRWPQLSQEFILRANPEVIIDAGRMAPGEPMLMADPGALARYRADSRWAGVAAVQAGRVYRVDTTLVSFPGPRLILLYPLLHDLLVEDDS